MSVKPCSSTTTLSIVNPQEGERPSIKQLQSWFDSQVLVVVKKKNLCSEFSTLTGRVSRIPYRNESEEDALFFLTEGDGVYLRDVISYRVASGPAVVERTAEQKPLSQGIVSHRFPQSCVTILKKVSAFFTSRTRKLHFSTPQPVTQEVAQRALFPGTATPIPALAPPQVSSSISSSHSDENDADWEVLLKPIAQDTFSRSWTTKLSSSDDIYTRSYTVSSGINPQKICTVQIRVFDIENCKRLELYVQPFFRWQPEAYFKIIEIAQDYFSDKSEYHFQSSWHSFPKDEKGLCTVEKVKDLRRRCDLRIFCRNLDRLEHKIKVDVNTFEESAFFEYLCAPLGYVGAYKTQEELLKHLTDALEILSRADGRVKGISRHFNSLMRGEIIDFLQRGPHAANS